MKNGRYSTALKTLIPSNPKEWTEAIMDLLEHAEEVDRLADQIADDLRRNAERFNIVAQLITTGHNPEDPMGYSSLHDISVNIARHRAKQESLVSLIRTNLGRDAKAAFFTVLREQS